MRKRLAANAGLILLASVVGAIALGGAVRADNLLVNGSFEKSDAQGKPDGWGAYPLPDTPGGSTKLISPGYQSPQAVVLSEEQSPSLYGLFSPPVPVADLPGEELLLTCYYKTEGTPNAEVSLVGFADPFLEKEWETRHLQVESQDIPPTPDWSLLSWHFRFLPGVREIVVLFDLEAAGKLFLDGVTLQPYPGEVTCKVRQAGVVEALPDRRLVEVELTNREVSEKKVQVVALALAPDRPSVQASSVVRLAGPRSQSVRLNYNYDYRQSHTLRLIVREEQSTTVYEQLDLPVPGLISARLVRPAFRASLMETLPTRSLVVSGRGNVSPELWRQMQISAQLLGTGRGEIFTQVDLPEDDEHFRLELPAPELLTGEHMVRVTAHLGAAEQTLDLPLRRLPPGPPQVGYDEHQRLWLNGQCLFPRGLYGIQSATDLQAAAQAGFNFVIVPSTRASYTVQKAAQEAGLAVVISTASMEESFWQHLQSKWGTSAVTLGWLPYSRPDLHNIAPQHVNDLYHLVRRVSPGHPVIETLASPSRAQYYTQAADILLAWSLPVPYSPLRMLGDMVEILRQPSAGLQPVWAVVQAAGSGTHRHPWLGRNKTGRPPTPAEMEALAYLALVHGADGLVWYSYNIPDSPGAQAYRLPQDAPELWAALPKLNLHLRWLAPVLLEGERETLPSAAEGAIQMAQWEYQGSRYIVAVNVTNRGLVTLLPLASPGSKAQVMFENRTLQADEAGEMQDSFTAYGVHVYVLDQENA